MWYGQSHPRPQRPNALESQIVDTENDVALSDRSEVWMVPSQQGDDSGMPVMQMKNIEGADKILGNRRADGRIEKRKTGTIGVIGSVRGIVSIDAVLSASGVKYAQGRMMNH